MNDSDGAPYRERLEELLLSLVRHGSLGVLLIDLSQLSQVEHDYGSKAYEKVLEAATQLFLDLRGGEVRASDILASSDKGGDAFLVFLSPKRTGGAARISELQAASERIENYFNKSLAALASPYLRRHLSVPVGFGLVLHNPLVMPERLVARLVNEAWECVRYQQMQQAVRSRAQLLEIILNNEIRTHFQPIFHIVDSEERSVMGYEALSRGPKGTIFESPLHLFETAAESDLVFEVDRACRLRALANSKSLAAPTKLFINILPSSMYDPDFHGANLAHMLDKLGLTPEQVVFEITEKYAIENYALFGEAASNFTQLGISIAVDDIGAGHSGLVKFDMELVRDIDGSYVRREMVKALKIFADKMGSTIIAEGIERQEELDTLLGLGVHFGQGYLLGRPQPFIGEKEPAVELPVKPVKEDASVRQPDAKESIRSPVTSQQSSVTSRQSAAVRKTAED
jgi:EAL domain-containing protein (putative c-di-GMP-specific phosphodiesterase class I)/GGDEF domain-containing protein